MKKKTNVLIFPAGEINSVELHDALSHQVNIRVFGASSVDRHGPYVFSNYRSGLPFISTPDFIERFNALLREWEIDLVFPTHDTVALFFAEHRRELEAPVVTADLETAQVCRDKKRTYDLFADCDFCPTRFSGFEQYPCFMKPRDGQGAQGTRLLRAAADVPEGIALENYVITEYLPGEELTVDCLTDAHSVLQAVLPRRRDRLMAGVSVAGEALPPTEEILQIAEQINQRLSFLGLWYFQIKQDGAGKYKLLEVSARCAGTMCLSRARGVNLPLLSVYAALGREISVFENPYRVRMDRTLISRYQVDYPYDTVYMDYDDTLVEGEQVNLSAIRFVYQCRNQGKAVVLLTRHDQDHDDTLEESMKRHGIPEALFQRIVRIGGGEEKADYICPNGAIFIDNAYAERKKIHDRLGIPVFDVEGIEVLTDWRS